MVNGTLLNFGKRYKDDLKVIFDQWPKFHLGLDALRNQKILKGIYYGSFVCFVQSSLKGCNPSVVVSNTLE